MIIFNEMQCLSINISRSRGGGGNVLRLGTASRFKDRKAGKIVTFVLDDFALQDC